jgi:hypothetical protein
VEGSHEKYSSSDESNGVIVTFTVVILYNFNSPDYLIPEIK